MKSSIFVALSTAVAVAVGCLLLFFSILELNLWLAKESCIRRWQKAGYEVSYAPLEGCMVRLGTRWVPASSIRNEEGPR